MATKGYEVNNVVVDGFLGLEVSKVHYHNPQNGKPAVLKGQGKYYQFKVKGGGWSTPFLVTHPMDRNLMVLVWKTVNYQLRQFRPRRQARLKKHKI
jgi:hypothetical protein